MADSNQDNQDDTQEADQDFNAQDVKLAGEEEVLSPAEEGERSASGSQPATTSDDDVSDMVEDVIGNKPEPGKPFSLAEEVEKDERALHDIPPDEAKIEEGKER